MACVSPVGRGPWAWPRGRVARPAATERVRQGRPGSYLRWAAQAVRSRPMSSALFDPVFGADRVAARLDDASWVAALVAVEVALSRAAAEHGVVPAADAERIAAVAADLQIDPAELGRAAVEGGNPVIPLVRLLRAAAGDAGRSVHPGATSQDVMDTAAVLLVGWAGRDRARRPARRR